MTEMRAALYDRYGPPEVLYQGSAPIPEPQQGEVLVRVHAAGVNGGELHARAGRLRLVTGRRFPRRTGIDFVGEMVESAAGLNQGDHVWGVLPRSAEVRGLDGSAAEYITVDARRVSLSPTNLTMVAAASLPAGGTTSITALRTKAGLRPGERLLVRGASGGVGSVAVQLGKALGAHVTALAGPRNLDFVLSLGADEALSYTTTKPADLGTFDVIMDTVGTEHPAYRRLLNPGGRMVAIAVDTADLLRTGSYVVASTVHGGRRVRFFSGNPRRELFAELTRYVEAGDLRPVVDTVHPLADIAVAHRALEAGGVRGKHILRIG
jgi:NADPH:quinone reductase-like Zn-dependent oxidoreductase